MQRINPQIAIIMARQQGIIRFTGRLGNTVGYLAKDGKGNSFDASRVLAAQVTNPQTIAQMDQRMKMAPVVNFYRGLRGILDHSWQSVKYGEPSRLFFYSQTLRSLSTAGVPYINKGDKQFVPWSFPVSQGSIAAHVDIQFSGASTSVVLPDLYTESLDNATVADVTEMFVQQLGIHAGQQLTFVFVLKQGTSYIPYYTRITLNSTDETNVHTLGIDFSLVDGRVRVMPYNAALDDIYDLDISGAALIISELVGNTWQRNATSMVIPDSLRATYNSQAAYDAMLASYRQTANSRESDWYLNGGGDEDGSSTVATVREVTLTTSTGDKTIAYYKVGGTKYAPYYTTEVQGALSVAGYRKDSDMAFTKQASMILAGFAGLDDLKTEYLALGYTLCTRDELLVIAPDLTIPE